VSACPVTFQRCHRKEDLTQPDLTRPQTTVIFASWPHFPTPFHSARQLSPTCWLKKPLHCLGVFPIRIFALLCYCTQQPAPVAASMVWTTRTLGSWVLNPLESWIYVVLLCVDTSLAIGRSPIQGVLLKCLNAFLVVAVTSASEQRRVLSVKRKSLKFRDEIHETPSRIQFIIIPQKKWRYFGITLKQTQMSTT